MNLNRTQLKNREYNQSQIQVGHPLKTLKGSTVKRSNLGIGKLIGGHLYFQKSYSGYLLDDLHMKLLSEYTDQCLFDFNYIKYDMKKGVICLVESPDFDTAREPITGRIFTVKDGEPKVTRSYNQIIHHKWTFVDNNYTGFDVAESWEWSKEWLSVLTETANGSSQQNWINQLQKFNLQ